LASPAEFQQYAQSDTYDEDRIKTFASEMAAQSLSSFRIDSLPLQVRAAVYIYYMRYHMILGDLAAGRGSERAKEILGSSKAALILPMPAIGILLAALKGWLGADLTLFYNELDEFLYSSDPAGTAYAQKISQKDLAELGAYLEHNPVPVAVVTSSIAYESQIVLNEVFKTLQKEVDSWPIEESKKKRIAQGFEYPEILYNAIVTASDSSEIRLKPHRDLYSIALHAIGVSKDDYDSVIGFEDSESGIIAIRAAGIGLAVALPFTDTSGHDFSAAAFVLKNQIPEAILLQRLFLDSSVLH
jgi:hypothetical protein